MLWDTLWFCLDVWLMPSTIRRMSLCGCGCWFCYMVMLRVDLNSSCASESSPAEPASLRPLSKERDICDKPPRSWDCYAPKWIMCMLVNFQRSLVAKMVKNPPAVQETWVWSLHQEDPLEKKEWLPTSVFLPGEFHGQRSLWAIVHGVSKSWA